jgi:hypothetical protein
MPDKDVFLKAALEDANWTWHAVWSGRSSRPGQVEQHHELFGLDDPVGQQSLGSTKGYRPATIAKATQAKDHAGLGRIHSKDRDDASDRADQHGWGAAEPLADLLGDQDLVGGDGPSSRDLIPGHDLGAITLGDALDQGPPLGKLLGRGRRRGRCLAHANSILAIQPGPQQLRTISEERWRSQASQPTRKGVLRIFVQVP